MKLYQHQQKIIDDNPDKIGLFLGTGTGKTLTAIRLAEKKGLDTIVICPKSLQENWQNELDKFSSSDIKFLIISKENFKKDLKELPGYETLIWDEAHYASGLKSQIHKSTISYIRRWNVKNIYLLTATPYMANCWSVFALGKLLGRDWKWYKWNKTFFHQFRLGKKPPKGVKDRRRMIWKQKDGIEKSIANIVNKIGVTARLEDLFDVPDQIFLHEFFTLTKEQEKAMESVIETHPIVEFTKYHQICGGSLKGDGYIPDQFYRSEKLSRTLDLVKENKKIAIICRYNNELKMIYDLLHKNWSYNNNTKCPSNIFVINGKTKDKDSIIFNAERAEESVILINAACSEGYNLPSFPIMVFYSLDFSLKNYIQMLGRIQRANHLKKNVYIHMTTSNTIDENIYQCIMNKQDFHIEIYAKTKQTKGL